MDKTPLTHAVEAAGGQSALARALSKTPGQVKQGHVWAWINRDHRPPAEYCPAIETLTGVRSDDLRPDLDWTRDRTGQVTGYHVRIAASGQDTNSI